MLQNYRLTKRPLYPFQAIDLYIDISSGTFFEAPEGSVQTPCDRLVTEIKNLSKSQLTRVINELYDEIGLINAKDQQGNTKLIMHYSLVEGKMDFMTSLLYV